MVRSVEFGKDGKCTYTTRKNTFTVGWTKGLVLNQYSETAPAYIVEKRNGKEYLMLEWKSGDYQFFGRVNYYVFVRA